MSGNGIGVWRLVLPPTPKCPHGLSHCYVLYRYTVLSYTVPVHCVFPRVNTAYPFSIKVQYNLWLDGTLSLISWMFLYEIYRNYTSQLCTVPAQPILHVAKLIWPVILGFLNFLLPYVFLESVGSKTTEPLMATVPPNQILWLWAATWPWRAGQGRHLCMPHQGVRVPPCVNHWHGAHSLSDPMVASCQALYLATGMTHSHATSVVYMCIGFPRFWKSQEIFFFWKVREIAEHLKEICIPKCHENLGEFLGLWQIWVLSHVKVMHYESLYTGFVWILLHSDLSNNIQK